MKKLDSRRVQSLFVLALVGLAYFVETQTLGFTLKCPLYQTTGLRCPGCGLTTGCIALLQGQWRNAAAANAGLTLALPLLIPFLGFVLWQWLQKKPVNGRAVTVFSTAFLIFFAAWGVLRNIWGI